MELSGVYHEHSSNPFSLRLLRRRIIHFLMRRWNTCPQPLGSYDWKCLKHFKKAYGLDHNGGRQMKRSWDDRTTEKETKEEESEGCFGLKESRWKWGSFTWIFSPLNWKTSWHLFWYAWCFSNWSQYCKLWHGRGLYKRSSRRWNRKWNLWIRLNKKFWQTYWNSKRGLIDLCELNCWNTAYKHFHALWNSK